MAGTNVDKLLDPMGETLQGIVRGRRGAGRLEVTVLWPQIEKALNAGVTVTAVWEALSKNGLVSIKLRGFSKEVKARREGARGSRPERKLAGAQPVAPAAAAEGSPSTDSSMTAGPDRLGAAERPPAGPRRPWRTGPREAPDPNAVFRPRDPLADE
jgi:hypothetical protein